MLKFRLGLCTTLYSTTLLYSLVLIYIIDIITTYMMLLPLQIYNFLLSPNRVY